MSNESENPVLVEGTEINCYTCKKAKPIIYPSSHFVLVELNTAMGLICDACADTTEKKRVPASYIRPLLDQTQLACPINGHFRPVEVSPDNPSSGAFQYWREIGHMVIDEMALWQEKVLKFTFGGMRYKGLWIKPHWSGSRVTRFTIAGDTPAKKLELDIYQTARLASMGFVESGRTNKTWDVELNEEEGEIPNASAIIVHILRYGYLLDPADLNTITPTLDIDTSEPEWKHMRLKRDKADFVN